MRGWIDRAWQPIQERYVRKQFPHDKKKNEKCRNWSMYLIEYMWKQGHDLWKDRCDKVHVSTGRNETEQQRRAAEAQVSALYKQAENVGHYDRSRVFGKTLREKLEEPVHLLQIWVDQAKPAVKQASRDYRKRMKQHTMDIRRYIKTTAQRVTKATRLGVARAQQNLTTRLQRPNQSTGLSTQERRRRNFDKGTASTNSNNNNPT